MDNYLTRSDISKKYRLGESYLRVILDRNCFNPYRIEGLKNTFFDCEGFKQALKDITLKKMQSKMCRINTKPKFD